MTTIIELRQPLWMDTPYGEGLAVFLTDYGPESDHIWTCIQQDAPHIGELWTWHNSEVRVMANRTMLRGKLDEIKLHPARKTLAEWQQEWTKSRIALSPEGTAIQPIIDLRWAEAQRTAWDKVADDLERLCCAETEGQFFDYVTDNITTIIKGLRRVALMEGESNEAGVDQGKSTVSEGQLGINERQPDRKNYGPHPKFHHRESPPAGAVNQADRSGDAKGQAANQDDAKASPPSLGGDREWYG